MYQQYPTIGLPTTTLKYKKNDVKGATHWLFERLNWVEFVLFRTVLGREYKKEGKKWEIMWEQLFLIYIWQI